MPLLPYELIVVGGGTAGLVTAAGAAYLGAKVALVEHEALGGDCLWTGCVPSKALIASARLAHRMRHADRLGLTGANAGHSFRDVMERMRTARARVARHDDPERFRRMGVDVIFGAARLAGPGRVEVEGRGTLGAPRIVIATGAVPTIPPIPGLDETGCLTHVTAFDRDDPPRDLIILGAGPVGLELAQVYARLGSRVTVLEMLPRILPQEDPDVAASVGERLESEGIEIVTGNRAERVEPGPRLEKTVVTSTGRRFSGDEILAATGRRPATAPLDLERAGVETEGEGVRVNERLETSATGVWAAGDVTGDLQFTHFAEHMAKVAVQNALLPLKAKVQRAVVPRVTYTDPEVAHVGLSEQEAGDRGSVTYRYEFAELDRAIVDAETAGWVKISADRRGRVLGATVVGHAAGDLIMPLVLAMKHGITLPKVASTIFPYPTLVEAVKRAADGYQRARLERLSGRILRRVVRWLA